MTLLQQLITIVVAALATLITRFSPFVVFSGKKVPKAVEYLGRALPGAVFGLLLVYCLKDVDLSSYPFGLGEALGVALTAIIYKWGKNTLLSILLGTLFYMFLIQVVFV